jgi:hypothetical protein
MCVKNVSLVAFAVELFDTAVADKVYKPAVPSDWVGSIGLVVVDMVAVHSLVAVIAIDHAVLEAAAYLSPSILTL